jgi:hypothetical protein
MRTMIATAMLLACVGCAHTNHSDPPAYYVPPPVASVPTKPVEYPCGHDMEVHVGNGDVNLPKLNLVMEGNKVDTTGYVLHLEDVSFHVREYCRQGE